MNILHLVPALESGGVERGTVDLAISLGKLGHTVVVVSSGGKMASILEENGIEHIRLPVHKKSPASLFLIPKIKRIIKSKNIDIVHASSRVPAWLGFFAARSCGVPFVTSCHGYYSRHLFSRVMGWGKLVMAISESIRERMTEDFGVPKDKIRLVYRGVDLAKFPYDADKYNSKKDKFIIINLGRLTPIKGQYEFIRAMPHVVERVKNVEAWIVGGARRKNDGYLADLKGLARKLKMERHVKFLGLRHDVPGLLAKADCLVLSTKMPEGFGRAVIEAGATGTACLASGVGGIKEIIDDGETGLLFPSGNEMQMAASIVRMLEDAELRRKCAANLRKKVEREFTLEKMARATLAVYEEAIGKSKR